MHKLTLCPADMRTINETKKGASRRPWVHGSTPFWGTRIRDAFNLERTCVALEVNLVKLVRNMHNEQPGEIEVLIEGCGMSSVGEELKQRARGEGISVNVVKTDIYPPEEYQELAQAEVNGGRGIDASGYHQLAPEELHTLGENRFHIIISRSGGLTYTKLPKLLGLKNIWHILRPKGEAHILTENVCFGVDDTNRGRLISGSSIRLKDCGTNTPEGEFLENTKGLHYKTEGDTGPHKLKIKKQAKFEAVFPPDDKSFVPSLTSILTREEALAHRTLFDLMENPPIEMSQEQFDTLRTLTRTGEVDSLGYVGRHGGVVRTKIEDGLALVLRYGRYYIVAVDEFGLIDRILWDERAADCGKK